jgi:ketosteroid isomerase-like protein
MSTEAHIEVVLDYFAGCNTGEIEHVLRTVDDDVVHDFLPAVHPPIRGAAHLANHWRKFKKVYDPTWRIDHLIGGGDKDCQLNGFPYADRSYLSK